jgi:hypothetical protein
MFSPAKLHSFKAASQAELFSKRRRNATKLSCCVSTMYSIDWHFPLAASSNARSKLLLLGSMILPLSGIAELKFRTILPACF